MRGLEVQAIVVGPRPGHADARVRAVLFERRERVSTARG